MFMVHIAYNGLCVVKSEIEPDYGWLVCHHEIRCRWNTERRDHSIKQDVYERKRIKKGNKER